MRNLKKYSNHSGYASAPEEPDKNKVSICKSENHTHYDKKSYLIYYWDASDGMVDGKWTDRIQGLSLTASGSPTFEDGLACLSYENYFSTNGNTSNFKIGRLYRIETEFIVPKISSFSNFIWDFGSLTEARHAFGFTCSKTGYFGDNAKLFANSSEYSVTSSTGGGNLIPYDVNVLSTVSYGCCSYDSTQDTQYFEYKGKKYLGPPHAITRFDANWSPATIYFGRGVINSTASQTADIKYIKSIKIYSYL